MKTIFTTFIFVSVGFLVNAQTGPEAFLKKVPAMPKDSCGITKAAMESFTQTIASLIDEAESQISLLNKQINAQAKTNEAAAKEAAMKQMSQYGLSAEEMNKLKNSKMTAADKQALANKVLQQQTNMSMGEVQNLSKMSEAGKKAYAEAYATEAMANAQANPKQQKGNENAKNTYELLSAQQAIMAKITANSQKIGNLYAAIENDPSGKEMLMKISTWHNKLMSMTGVDYGQGKKMDSLSVLIKNEQSRYCDKFTPKYRAALRQHESIVKSSLPDFQRLGEIIAEITKAQTGIVTPPESTAIGGMEAITEYLGKLKKAYQFKLYYPEDNQL